MDSETIQKLVAVAAESRGIHEMVLNEAVMGPNLYDKIQAHWDRLLKNLKLLAPQANDLPHSISSRLEEIVLIVNEAAVGPGYADVCLAIRESRLGALGEQLWKESLRVYRGRTIAWPQPPVGEDCALTFNGSVRTVAQAAAAKEEPVNAATSLAYDSVHVGETTIAPNPNDAGNEGEQTHLSIADVPDSPPDNGVGRDDSRSEAPELPNGREVKIVYPDESEEKYFPSELHKEMDVSPNTYNKYAVAAGVRTPDAGGRNHRYTEAERLKVIREFATNSKTTKDRDRARALIESSKKPQTNLKSAK